MPDRHPLGRTCRAYVLVALLLMPYALVRYAVDEARSARRGQPTYAEPSRLVRPGDAIAVAYPMGESTA